MKVRIRFSKTGALVYIGHLDVMRYFQKLLRRSSINVAYSEGFSPHQILSFSHPLPLGMESIGEYADIELTDKISSEEAVRVLNANSVPEIRLLSFKELPEKCENAMASCKAARYTVKLTDDMLKYDIQTLINDFLALSEIVVLKKSKKEEKEVDIRPFIYELFVNGDGLVEMLISSGSSNNLKPELVMTAMFERTGFKLDEDDLIMRRIDQYTITAEAQKLISLDDIGSIII